MANRSALINVMAAAARKAAKGLIRDFGEVEQLQVRFDLAAEIRLQRAALEIEVDVALETRPEQVHFAAWRRLPRGSVRGGNGRKVPQQARAGLERLRRRCPGWR